jgi:hypothetical protein
MTLDDLASNAAHSCLLSGWLLKRCSELREKEEKFILAAEISGDMLYFGITHKMKKTTIGSSGGQCKDELEDVYIRPLRDLAFHVVTLSGMFLVNSAALRECGPVEWNNE